MTRWFTVTGLFALTAIAEILGCYCAYIVVKNNAAKYWLLVGAVSLAVFAWLLTLHPTGSAGRIYAAYGGVYVATAIFWMWGVERQVPDRWDILGGLIAVVGMSVIAFGPRP